MNPHFQSYLIGSAVLTILWWVIQHTAWFGVSDSLDPDGHFSGSTATTQSLEGLIHEVQQLPQ